MSISDATEKFLRKSNRSEEINELAAALSKAQAEIESAPRSENNPFFKSKYADLASIRDTIREPFGKHGLSVVQIPQTDDGEVLVTTMLMHSSGQWISGTLALKPVKQDPQAMGSAITYARRYSLMAFAGVAPDDDDGNDASQEHQPVTKPKKEPLTHRSEIKPSRQPNHFLQVVTALETCGVNTYQDRQTARAVIFYCSNRQHKWEDCERDPAIASKVATAILEAQKELGTEELMRSVNELIQELTSKKETNGNS